MTTYNQIGLAPSSNPHNDKVFIVRGRADFSKNPTVAGDSISVAVVPKGTLMLVSYNMVVRAEGAASTIDIGTTAAGNEIDDAVDGNANAGVLAAGDTCKFNGDGFIEATADTTIYVTSETAATDYAIIDVTILCATTNEYVLGS